MEITPKAMEIEHIRIKRLNLKKEKAYAIGKGVIYIQLRLDYSYSHDV